MPIATGYKSTDPDLGSSGIQWALFPASVTDDEALEELGWESYSSGAGGSFGWSPTVRRTGTRLLVSQHVGLDV